MSSKVQVFVLNLSFNKCWQTKLHVSTMLENYVWLCKATAT
uniref:Uncharacterized protein n=1 Tax=Arundo donax TaxID=35708 RepID=A0A0A9HIS2_ARUDO